MSSGYETGRGDVRYVVIDPQRRAKMRTVIPLRHGPMIHDVGFTDRFVIQTARTEVHVFGPGRMSLEPVFVPRTGDAAEDDGYVMAYVYDAHRDRSDVVIWSAQDFTAQPLATIELPVRVPFGFHGDWVSMDRGAYQGS
jgi:carotenoid cleavage dioxygenase-like enzyme